MFINKDQNAINKTNDVSTKILFSNLFVIKLLQKKNLKFMI